MYYIDGCSYTFGHNDSTYYNTWAFKICPGMLDRDFRVVARPAKSNEAIFVDFMQNVDTLTEEDTVIIYWSHSERLVSGLQTDEPEFTIKDYKNSQQDGIWFRENLYRDWLVYLISTAAKMKAVKDMCIAKNIKFYFLTVDHYYWFKKAEELTMYSFIDELTPHVFNWPLSDVKMYHKFNYNIRDAGINQNDIDIFSFYWALTAQPLTTAFALQKIDGKNYLDADYKHLNVAGNDILQSWLEQFIDDSTKDLSYQIEQMPPEAAKCFTDPLSGYSIYKDPDIHWVEARAIKVMNRLAVKNAEFIYE